MVLNVTFNNNGTIAPLLSYQLLSSKRRWLLSKAECITVTRNKGRNFTPVGNILEVFWQMLVCCVFVCAENVVYPTLTIKC